MALVLLIAALAFARDRGVDSVTAALQPAPGSAAAAGPSYEGWAEPPAYTGLPTLYLPEVSGEAPVSVPRGDAGDAARLRRARTASTLPRRCRAPPPRLAEAAPGIAAAEFPVGASGSVALRQGGTPLGAWSFTMEEDSPPEIALTGAIERAPTGETRFSYTARDDYGIAGARAEITLDLGEVDRAYGLVARSGAAPGAGRRAAAAAVGRRRGARRDAGRGLLQASRSPACR